MALSKRNKVFSFRGADRADRARLAFLPCFQSMHSTLSKKVNKRISQNVQPLFLLNSILF